MKQPTIQKPISEKINNWNPGRIFFVSDFFSLVKDIRSINVILSRLIKKGEIQRIARGIFAKPKYSKILKKYVMPGTLDVANAIARKHKWTIYPGSDAALNITGISTQVPNAYIFYSDGPYRNFNINGVTIQFKHANNRVMKFMDVFSFALIETLIALKDKITDKEIKILCSYVKNNNIKNTANKFNALPAWMYKNLSKILEGTSCE